MSEQSAAGVVRAGEALSGERHGLGVSVIEFKVITPDLLVLENVFHAPGGPPRHLHLEQDEWFYALEGEFAIEVGDVRHVLRPGDSVSGHAACRTSGRAPAVGACSSPSRPPAPWRPSSSR